jgi:fatty-acyl-CoA synthase
VNDCAVVGRSHPEWGERPVAFVVGTRCPDLQAWVEERLQPFQRPDELFWVDSLPRNSMGKLDRTSLRKQAHGAHGLGEFRRG